MEMKLFHSNTHKCKREKFVFPMNFLHLNLNLHKIKIDNQIWYGLQSPTPNQIILASDNSWWGQNGETLNQTTHTEYFEFTFFIYNVRQ